MTAMTSKLLIIAGEIEKLAIWLISQDYDFSFNNREIAFGVLIITTVCIMITNKNLRTSLMAVLMALFNKHFVRIYFEIIVYFSLVVHILYRLNYWEFKYTKDTLLWLLLTASYLTFRTVDNNKEEKLFQTLLRDTIGITIVFEFLQNTYTFPVIVEIIIIATLIVVGMLIGYVDIYPEKAGNGEVKKFLTGLSTIIGLTIILYLTINVGTSYKKLFTVDMIKRFFLPIIYTIMYIPYLAYLATWVTYDEALVPLRLNKNCNRWLRTWFKIRLLLHCGIGRQKIMCIRKNKYHLIINMKNKKDVDRIFDSSEIM